MDQLTFVEVELAEEQNTRWAALMIQLGKFVGGGVVAWWGGGVVGWLTPTTYIQLAGAGSTKAWKE